MLNLSVDYCRGYLAAPVVEACRQRGLFSLLDLETFCERRQLIDQLHANETGFDLALEILESLGWIERGGEDGIRRTAEGDRYVDLSLTSLYAVEPEQLLTDETHARALRGLIDRCFVGPDSEDSAWLSMARGAVLVPLVVASKTVGSRLPQAIATLVHEHAADPSIDAAVSLRLVLHVVEDLLFGDRKLVSHTDGTNVPFSDLLSRLAHNTPAGAEEFITSAARDGLFNDDIPVRYPHSSDACRFSMHELKKREYIIRNASEADLERLAELEKLCWRHTRTPKKLIRERLRRYPQGQFVLEKDGEILGVVYTQRIANADALTTRTAMDVHELHEDAGRVVQLLAVNIDPRAQNASYGDQLLEFMLQRCGLMTGVEQVVGVTLCKNYEAASGVLFDDYIHLEGSSQDPVLAFHHAHGADVVGALPGYRPQDRANLSHGVLVSYDILNRCPRRGTEAAVATTTPRFERTQIACFVTGEAAQLLGMEAGSVDADRPVMEMGLDSADLLKLQRLCEGQFGLKLQAGFFFEYSSINKVVDHLVGVLAPAPSEPVTRVNASHVDEPQAQHVSETDIAVVGMSCKLPGGIENADDFWRVLSSGKSLIGRFPAERCGWPSPDDYPAIDRGGFVRDAEMFDAAFFRISPAEAQITDPQQRMLLELVWSCFEDAGIPPTEFKGTNTGVFVGASNTDYSRLMSEAGLEIEAHHGVGSSLAILANRISYFFDFSGPSMLIDTACSSSLVALHTAIQSLRSGECASALVGGVNLICHPSLSIAYHKAGMLAHDGRCKVFDAKADGYVRAEGAVVLMLTPLQAALADGNQIHAVIKGSATNHGGLAGGLTVPNPQKQKELLVAAWRDAGIVSQDLSYIEAHGTGTSLGDPIEIQGVQAAYAEMSAADRSGEPCGVGSVKSNVGHLESAAGITGLLKIIVSLRNRQIPASINFSELNPKIGLENSPLYIQDQLHSWRSPSPRVAAVSSFGSGGTNAHAVVQEYVRNPRADCRDDQCLFVLSAATQDRLRESAARAITWLERNANDANFADAIYTWQVGRSAMQDRLAIRATDHEDLLAKLTQWYAGNEVTDCWFGQVAQKWSSINRVWQTKAGRQLIDQALFEGDLEFLGTTWTSGIEIDWHKYYVDNRTGKRDPVVISLPTYPFAKERYWIDTAPDAQRAMNGPAASVIHPLLTENTSDLSEQRFTTRFSGDEFFLSDHVVKGARMLPGVCYLEMARAAAAAAAASAGEKESTIRLRDVVWTSPIIADEPVRIHTALHVDDQGEIGYEIYSDDETVHSQGRVSFAAGSDERIDIEMLRSGTDKSVDAARLYDAWSAAGVEYGPAFKGIRRVWIGQDYALAEVELPACVSETRDQYVLHPSVLDGALQATMALSLDSRATNLPFAVDEVEIFRETPSRAFVYVRERAGRIRKLDIDLCDEEGRVCARLLGYASRPLDKETGSLTDLVSLVPTWEPVTPSVGARWPQKEPRLLLVGGTPEEQAAIRAEFEDVTSDPTDDIEHVIWLTPPSRAESVTDERLITEQSDGVVSGLQLIRKLLQLGYDARQLGLTVVTRQTQATTNDEQIQPAHAAVHGLIGSLAKEYAHWRLRLVDLPATGEFPLADILNLPADEHGNAWAYRAGEWLRQRFARYDAPAGAPVWREGGVYVVIGGAGGIGESFSEYLIRNHRAQLIWIGRRELDADIQAKVDRLAGLGPVPQYISADATNLESLTKAHQQIKTQHREIHGVVHAAGVLLDKSLAQMDDARFRTGLAAKIDVCVRMAQVFAQERMDLALFFSSVLSFTKTPGQSNYLAGSTFEDAFAHELRRAWPCSVKVMNWGYWGSKGMASSEAYRARMAQNGFGSIEPEEGMSALERLLTGPVSQMALFKGENRGLASLEIADESMTVADGEVPNLIECLSRQTDRRLPDSVTQVEGVEELQWFMQQLLSSQLQALDGATAPRYRRWLDESRRVLEGVVAQDPSVLWDEWETRKAQWLDDESLRAHVRLVDITLRALPDILAGKRKATDVIFPSASVELIDGIYKHNPVADHFNALVAEAVAEFVEARLKEDGGSEIRIIEFGAGTGGTSEAVFERLEPYADRIAEYCYTDISKAFLMRAEQDYGPTKPYLTYRLLNVERPLESQGMVAGSYDVAIATSVLHATRNIRRTLRHVKAALKRNGVLVLNELLGNSLFLHLTSGLLEGWWLYEDVALRTPGTPLLSPANWERALTSEGFENILFPAAASQEHGQQIIVAKSDGIIRRKPLVRKSVSVPPTPSVPAQTSMSVPHDATLRERTIAAFKKVVGATLKLNPQKIDSREEMEQYGFDSILVVKLVNALNGVFAGVRSTLFFEYRTIDALVDHLLETEKEAAMRWVGMEELPPESSVEEPVPESPVETEPATTTPPRRRRSRMRPIATASDPVPTTEKSSPDIAVIGLSGRYPQAIDIDAFWRNLRDGMDCIVEVPKDRWDWQKYFTEDRTENGRHFSRFGGFIDGVDEFDPLFFNISPRDAKYIDPQERLFLQHAWMAVEDAGYTRPTLQGAEVGVYAGVMYSEYQLLANDEARADDLRMGFAGNLASIANRVSYALNLHGPSMIIDTMCSSSLTAIHLACQDLKQGRTGMAIVGGVNVSVHPNKYRMLSAGQFISSDGHCQAFGEGGDGYIPSEGVGVVVLKRLADAERDGDHIYGVIRGSDVNHGGKTNGYTVPNPRAQASTISRALRESNVDARHVSYIEAHGTGTKLGDPIEIAALSKAFGHDTKDTDFCLVGSAKSNIGHCESAAGVAGLTKVLLQLQHRQIVPSLHSAQLNPFIDFDRTPFVVNQALRPWDAPVLDGRTLPRIAGISSFGAGGSNAHVIVQEHVARTRPSLAVARVAIVLSARTPEQLKQKSRELLAYIKPREIDLASLAWTLQTGREAMDERFAFVANSIAEVIEKLEGYVGAEQVIEDAYEGQKKRNKEALSVFNVDADLQQAVEKWLAGGKLGRLLELWVKGLELDWSKLYGEARPQRVSLPAYPFAKDRYWVDATPAGPETVVKPAALHPLLHRNTSDLNELRFSSTFQGDDALPPSVCLDMARAAIEQVLPEHAELTLRDTAFGAPIASGGEIEVSIALWRDGDDVEFEIYSDETIICQGRAERGEGTSHLLRQAEPLALAVEDPPASVPARKEIVFVAERKKRAPIALSSPKGAVAPATAAPKTRITLSTAGNSPRTSIVSPVRLYDCGRSIFSIEIAAAPSNDVMDHFLQALDRVQQESAIKVLTVSGIEHCFDGGLARYNEAIDRRLFKRLVSFAYPVIAVLPGDVTGSGFLAAALCDFMVCNEAAAYGFTDREPPLAPTDEEAALLRERFGALQADHLLYLHGQATGRQLREWGWTCPTLPALEIETHAMQLATALSTKSQDALRFLKGHLTRRLVGLVDALIRVEEVDEVTDSHDVEVIGMQDAIPDGCKALVLVCDDADAPEDIRRRVLESEIPVVAALPRGASGNTWLEAQFCDGCVYSETGIYSARGVENAQPFIHRLGEAAAEIVLSGAAYRGRELKRRVGTFLVSDGDQVIATAKQVAASLAKVSRETVAAWRRRAAEMHTPAEVSVSNDDNAEPIAVKSKVVTATSHPNGVVVVTMQDRDAKNMFSDALLEGIREVFAHIERTPEYKVVVLTGYDTFFSSGGTRENLVAIHEGQIRFTDLEIFRAALDCRLPVIAAMQGHGIGAGWTLGLFADVVLMSEESRYVSPYMNYGFTPGAGATCILPAKLGTDLARESLFTGRQYTGAELKQRGVRLHIAPRSSLLAAAMSVAEEMARSPRAQLIELKRQLADDLRRHLEETIPLELSMHDLTFVGRSDTLAQIESHFQPEVESPRSAEVASFEGDVTGTLKTLLANELLITEDAIDKDVQLVDLGLDSISAVTWIRKINEEFGTSIEATKVYAYPTLIQLGEYVKSQVPQSAPVPPPAASPSIVPPPVASARAVSLNGDVATTLKTLLANELQIAESAIDESAQLIDLGLDSINAVTWIRKINDTYGTAIEATKAYAHPTLLQLSEYVKKVARPSGLPVAQPAGVPTPTVKHAEPIRRAETLTARRHSRRTSPFRNSEPIAIIGMASRFPQAASVDEFWRNIAEGRNCITRVPTERWDLDSYFQEGDPAPGKTNCQWAGVVDDCDQFDPLFFNIAPTEAESMDPQQRLFLQACWHGIEDAGYDVTRLSASKCGVFVGCTVGEYQHRSPEDACSAQGFTGNAMSILAGRIAYVLNLQGPCISIDTACSSSLVAIAQACDSLISGGSDLVLAGGVYVMTGPEMHIKTAQAAMLSPDGRCFTFDQRANGFVPGEGVGVVLLKRLSDAECDGDIIHAVIEGWGVNQDGKSNGITAPNPESQTRLEQEVYDRFGIDPADIHMVEAHGTGTKLGDPIEVEGLKTAFSKYTRKSEYCALGSVKSNIGHCLGAAGIAGTLKLALALKHKQLPPTINYEGLNEHIDLENSPFYVNDHLREWALHGSPRRLAAVSSFGFSGTNAHLVVGEYCAPARVEVIAPTRLVVPFSARTSEQLRQKAADLLEFIRTRPASLAEIAYTLQVGRVAMEERLAIVAGSIEELSQKLAAWLDGELRDDVRQGKVPRNRESLGILSDDEDVKDAILDKWIAKGKLSKLVEYWVRGLSLDWNRLYGATKPRRITLPAYPFAKESYWIDERTAEQTRAVTVHPLLHRNTSELKELRYTTSLAGNEFFLADHRVGREKVLPGVAYLEMARAAIVHTWPKQSESNILELVDVVWMKPVVVQGEREISISLFPEDDGIEYEIYSTDVHCQGHAVFRPTPATARLDLEQLRKRMQHARMEGSEVYAMFAVMGLHYGPAHQGIEVLNVGDGELLAQLRLPEGLDAGRLDWILHPSVMDSALQASAGLLVDPARVPDKPPVPFALESLRALSPCTKEMTAWVRFASGSSKLDIDLCDERGGVCVEMRGLTVRTMKLDATAADFDENFYEKLVADVVSGDVSVDEAVQRT